MKYLIPILFLFACSEKSEVPVDQCTCHEVKDKEINAYEYPTLRWDYRLYIKYCDSNTRWITVDQSTYNSINRGDCY